MATFWRELLPWAALGLIVALLLVWLLPAEALDRDHFIDAAAAPSPRRHAKMLERETRLELATSTLARLCSRLRPMLLPHSDGPSQSRWNK